MHTAYVAFNIVNFALIGVVSISHIVSSLDCSWVLLTLGEHFSTAKLYPFITLSTLGGLYMSHVVSQMFGI